MKKYKFRAWNKRWKAMEDWDILKNKITGRDFNDDDSLIIMQYTGLKDEKGKEICEGDIIEFRPWNKDKTENYVVKFVVDDASYRGIKEKKNSVKVLSLINSEQGLKVVGNIYENPELMKEEE